MDPTVRVGIYKSGKGGGRRDERMEENVKPKMAPWRRVAASYETKGWREPATTGEAAES